MRRVTAVLAACLCAISGCTGGAAQEPYDGVVVSSGTSPAPPTPAAPGDDAEPMASEVDVPWTIALLSEVEAHPVKRPATVVDAEPAAAGEPVIEDLRFDLQLAIDHAPDEKPAPSKSCTGVVKGRS